MIATALLVSNAKYVIESQEEQKRLGLPNSKTVEPTYTEHEFCFPLMAMTFAFITVEGYIKTYISGQEILFKYNEVFYNRIKEHFKHN